MILTFNHGKKVTDIVSVVPSDVSMFVDEISNYNFSKAKSLKLKDVIGFDQHRLAPPDTTAADLCQFAFEYLRDKKKLLVKSIDALIFISHSPDHFIPPTSSILHGKLDLKEDCLCFDINHGCAGYMVGLQQAFMLLDQQGIDRVALLTGDTISKKVSNRDRNIFPVIGDAGAVSIIENDHSSQPVRVFTKNRGRDAMVLKIPAGAFRQPNSQATALLEQSDDGNFRSLNDLHMEGGSVFSFVQSEIPLMIDELLANEGMSKDDIDYFIFHQPNRFMLEKLADKTGISRKRMPNNIVENFGNSNSTTIPVNISYNLSEVVTKPNSLKFMLAGFGVGLTWSGSILNLSNLNTCELIEYDGHV